MPYIDSLPATIKERGYAYTENSPKDILITGFNPSFRNGEQTGAHKFSFAEIMNDSRYDTYWSPIKRMVHENAIDLRDKTDYTDIFYFREREQRFFKKEVLSSPSGMQFAQEQLNLTQHIIEETVRPKLLIVKNKEAAAYFGLAYKAKGWVWMGYEFEEIEEMPAGNLYRITGLIDSEERIAPEIQTTNLNNTLVLFTCHISQFTPKWKRPTAALLKSLLGK